MFTLNKKKTTTLQVFTDIMAKELFAEFARRQTKGLSEVEELWIAQYRDRKIISEFIKDKALGKKRQNFSKVPHVAFPLVFQPGLHGFRMKRKKGGTAINTV
jgi:hypothetical protein